MDEYTCFLVTVLYQKDKTLLSCALKVENDLLSEKHTEYVMEAESREYFHSLLPLHVQSCGPVVKVEPLFEVHTYCED